MRESISLINNTPIFYQFCSASPVYMINQINPNYTDFTQAATES